jgi:hypothetical protein
MSWLQPVENYEILKSIGINSLAGSVDLEVAKEMGFYGIPGYRPGTIENGHVFAWIFDDEPDMPVGRGEDAIPRQVPEVVAEKCARIKNAHTERPVFMTFTGHFTPETSTYTEEVRQNLYPEYIKSADVVGFDNYPIYGRGYAARLNWVGDGVTLLREMAGEKPIYSWIETSKGSRWMTYDMQPDVLPIHTRNEVWQAITRGATAIGYFTHAWFPKFTEFAPSPEMQTELSRLNIQISRLAPAILSPLVNTQIEMNFENNMNCNLKATDYYGDIYIFALNMDLGEGAVDAKQYDPIYPRSGLANFIVNGLKPGTVIEVVDEDRNIIAKENQFSDKFGPLVEHIYRFKLN